MRSRGRWRGRDETRVPGERFGRANPSPSWERGGDRASGERQAQFRVNPIRRRIEIAADFGVREADHPHAEPLQNLRASGVIVRKPLVLLAVPPDRSPGVDGEFDGVTVKVDDKPVERNLTAELCAVKARAAQALPKNVL